MALSEDPAAPRRHLLDVVGRVENGCLEFTWFHGARHVPATVEGLAAAMRAALVEIIDHCGRPNTGGRTPSDFPLASLDQATVDRLVGDGRGVEDVYPGDVAQDIIVRFRESQKVLERELWDQ